MELIQNYFASQKDAYLQTLADLVNIDSHSNDLEGIAKVADYCKNFLSKLGNIEVEIIKNETGCSFLKASFKGTDKLRVMILGHMDTVFPKGTASMRPFSIDKKLAQGPGVADMKAGVCSALYLLKAISENDKADFPSITLFLNSDEETGSNESRESIEKLAQAHDVVLVFEPGRSNGDVVTGRKGIGEYHLSCTGVAAHAGTNHADGKNAIVELAYKAIALSKLTSYEKGTTLNVGTFEGGSASNVVPDHAEIDVDVRFQQLSEVPGTEAAIQNIAASNYIEGVTTQLTGGLNRPPMEENESNLHLYELYRETASQFNYSVGKQFVGGGSDGNLTGALNIPTLDGLGPCGAGFHSEKEYMEIDSVLPRLCTAYVFLQRLITEF